MPTYLTKAEMKVRDLDVAKDFNNGRGLSKKELSSKYGVHTQTIGCILKRNGINSDLRKPYPEHLKKSIRTLYKEGNTYRQIMDKLSVSSHAVAKYSKNERKAILKKDIKISGLMMALLP